jgi:cytochrome b
LKEYGMNSVLVWDIPTRLFHWLFAVFFTVAFFTSGSDSWTSIHVFAGLLTLGLVAYRMMWGVIGSRYARFSSFLFSPVTAIQYLLATGNGNARRHVGHNPAGSWMIYVMLLLGSGIAIFGLATLSSGEQFQDIHEVLANMAVGIVVAHIAGVTFASVLHQENLPRAMITGRKQGKTEQGIRSGRPFSALLLLVLVAAFSVVYWQGWDPQARAVTLPFLSEPLVLDAHEGEGSHKHHSHHSNWLDEEDWT